MLVWNWHVGTESMGNGETAKLIREDWAKNTSKETNRLFVGLQVIPSYQNQDGIVYKSFAKLLRHP
jgi:hypothetical protein